MKLSAAKSAAFLKQPDPAIRVVLIFGADRGLVRERVKILGGAIVDDLSDPFRVSELTGADIKSDPGRLMDEAAAQSLTGGQRLVMVRLGGEDISPSLVSVLDDTLNQSLIILEAGEMTPKSPVRKLIEKDKKAAAIACYTDNDQALNGLIDAAFRDNGKRISREGREYLMVNLGSDRMVSRSELDKLIIYLGDQEEASLEDVVQAVGDSGILSLDEIIYAAADGNKKSLERNLDRALTEGASPIAILRSAIRHFQRLHLASGHIIKGQTSSQAMKTLRPPVMFMFSDRFGSQLNRWTGPKINRALFILTEAEIDCKSTGLPAEAICSRALMSLSQAARR